MKFKKWLLNVIDSLVKTLKNTDNIMKLLFCVPAFLAIATVQLHAKSSGLCTETGSTGIPFYFSPFCLFLSLLFSIVVFYLGLGYGSKRKVSSFVVLVFFSLVYFITTILYLIVTLTDIGIMNMSDKPAIIGQSVVIQVICLICCAVGIVFAALKIDPEYYKERN